MGEGACERELQLQHEGDDDVGLSNETVVRHEGGLDQGDLVDEGANADLEGAECIVDVFD